jgi:Arc/MetJ-type ribon-helix-helix transcriptional regulator
MSMQVAVRLDDQLLRDLDWLVVRCSFENRAEAIRAALGELTERERQREIDERIIAAYTAMPQRDDETISPDFTAWDQLDDDDWSDWA